jgi:predicted nucleotidyltransferase
VSTEAVRHRQRAFEAFAEAALDARGEHIHGIILYGSVARREATERSDVDVLIILDEGELPEELTRRPNKLTDLAFDVGLEYNVKISLYIQTMELFENRRDRPFLQNVLQEGRSFQGDNL